MSRPFLVGVEIAFDEAGSSFSDATAYIRLEDTSLADAASVTIVEGVFQGISHQTGGKEKPEFSLRGQIPNENARYTVRVHVDVDGDGQVSQGDYISMESYPVLTHGYPDHVSVRVRQIK